MRTLTSVVTLFLLIALLVGFGRVGAQELKTPQGCRASAGAKAGADGYAARVVHEKSGIELVLLPSGQFTMGATGINSDSLPPHAVKIAKAFYIGRTEVRNDQYRRFVEAAGYDGKADADPAYDMYLRHWRGESLMSKADESPVVWVSWKNAQAFCAWAGLTLPTEAEWEYAARAGTTTHYSNGDDPKRFSEIGWSLVDSKGLTHPVAQKQPNVWGLYDMLGNVWEWCEDDFVYRYDGARTDGTARIGNPRLLTRVLRGGSWSNSNLPSWAGAAARFNTAPENASNDVGFRVVLRLE